MRVDPVVIALEGSIARKDIGPLCEHAQAILESSAGDLMLCDVRQVRSDACAVDALARLQLTARRLGRRMQVVNVCEELRGLLVLMGLQEVMYPMDAGNDFRFGTPSR